MWSFESAVLETCQPSSGMIRDWGQSLLISPPVEDITFLGPLWSGAGGKTCSCNSRTWVVKDFQSWSATSAFYLVWLPWAFDQFPWSRFQCHPSLIKSVFLDLGSNHQYFLNFSGDSNVRPRLKSSVLSIYCVTGERITWFLLY